MWLSLTNKKKHKINYNLLYNITSPKHPNYLIKHIIFMKSPDNLLIFYNVLHIKGFYENKKVKYIK